MSEQTEPERLATQRRNDLDQIRTREAERDRAQGKREGLAEAHTAEQDRHLAAINGSMTQVADELAKIKDRLSAIETAAAAAVAAAAATAAAAEKAASAAKAAVEKGVSTRTFLLTAGLLLVAIVGLFIGAGGTHP